MGIAEQSVQNAVGQRRFPDRIMPFVDGKLRGQDHRPLSIPVLQDLQQGKSGDRIQRLKTEVVWMESKGPICSGSVWERPPLPLGGLIGPMSVGLSVRFKNAFAIVRHVPLRVNIDVASNLTRPMRYSHAVRHSTLKKVLPPESRSVAQVSRETGINYQTIRNWIKQSKSGFFDGGLHGSSPRRLTPKEKYELVVEAAGIGDDNLSEFLRGRCLHTEHLTIWDQELRIMLDKLPTGTLTRALL